MAALLQRSRSESKSSPPRHQRESGFHSSRHGLKTNLQQQSRLSRSLEILLQNSGISFSIWLGNSRVAAGPHKGMIVWLLNKVEDDVGDGGKEQDDSLGGES